MNCNRILIISGFFLLFLYLIYNIIGIQTSSGFFNYALIIFGSCFLLFGIAQEKILNFFGKINELFESKTYHILFIALIVSLLIRLFLLPERWINPDEGAHLYDAKFILDGKIPFVDYESRMPVYAYILAAWAKIFGCNYLYMRLLPLFANIGICIFIFLIGKKLFNSNRIALLASIIYLFLPLSIIWSVVVKTELIETFFVCAGMYFLFSYIKSEEENNSIVFISGIFYALAYYVRKSAIIMLIASLLIIIYFYRNDIYRIIKTYGLVLLGYSFVVLIILLYFGNFLGFSMVWNSTLNPLDTIIDPIIKITEISTETTTSTTSNILHQPYYQTILSWKWTLILNSFIFFGIFLFISLVIYNIIYNKNNDMFETDKSSLIFLCIWIVSIFVFYLYYTIGYKFYIQYFGEVLPVLALTLAYAIYFIINEKKSNKIINNYIGLISIVMIALYLLSICFFSVSSDCVWSPDTVDEVSHYIESHSDEYDVVMSGAMIWTFESNTKPFINITHPLMFLYTISEKNKNEIEYQMEHNKPEFIILDGYTEKTYLRQMPEIYDVINESYILTYEVNGSSHPVKIYEIDTNE
ncbi:MAG: Dolichyl-phosphate-mannose-protein mannosyltransferase [ANME-2 cluster archaeon HR1]|nr:MAG: Dolichyl-phosphate-mannose-protein mannosyltransferase [ANME-2 cluster archaeon HR1]